MNWLKHLFGRERKGIPAPQAAKLDVQEVDLSTLSEEQREKFEAAAHGFERQLQPKLLLINMCGPWHERRTGECWIAVGGGYADYGKTHPDAPTWPQKQAYFEQHEAVGRALRRLSANGIMGRFAASGNYNLSAFYFIIKYGDAEVTAIRELAKLDFGIVDEHERSDGTKNLICT